MNQYRTPRRILLHIGWPKTGTTTLQKHGLNRADGFRYLGKVPFAPGKAAMMFKLVHLVAYCSEEKFDSMQGQVLAGLQELEVGLFGDVDAAVPAIISEEGFLSALLKPSDHQHHGFSTASLRQMADRLARLQDLWNVSFEVLFTERDPMQLLHSYYAQLHHILTRFKGLGSFQEYIAVGTSDLPAQDLGFRYLRAGHVAAVIGDRLGADRVFAIAMQDLFTPGAIHLGRWHPDLKDIQLDPMSVENRRTVPGGYKVAHLRPLWVKKTAFRLGPFVNEVRSLYRIRHSEHKDLEVRIEATPADSDRLFAFLRTQMD